MGLRAVRNKPIIETEGEKTNPTTTTVMADTGALSQGAWEFRITVGASAAAHFQVQRRNAANDTNVGDVPVVYGVAAQSGQYVFAFDLHEDERVRVMMDDNLTGTAAVIINGEKLL